MFIGRLLFLKVHSVFFSPLFDKSSESHTGVIHFYKKCCNYVLHGPGHPLLSWWGNLSRCRPIWRNILAAALIFCFRWQYGASNVHCGTGTGQIHKPTAMLTPCQNINVRILPQKMFGLLHAVIQNTERSPNRISTIIRCHTLFTLVKKKLFIRNFFTLTDYLNLKV